MSLASYPCSTPGCTGRRDTPVSPPVCLCETLLSRLLRAATSRGGLGAAAGVAAERSRRRELAELVAHHVLDHVQPEELPAVVDQERVADELRHDGAVARPGLDRLLGPRAALLLDFLKQTLIDI